MWVTDNTDDKIYAYNLTTGLRDTAKEFNTLAAADNNSPYGIWTDGTTMWVADNTDEKIYAYRMSDKQRDSAKDFNTLAAAGNTRPTGIWSDGTTMWVVNQYPHKIFAYRMSDKQRDSDRDLNNLADVTEGIWSDGTTMWIVSGEDDNIQAYRMSDHARDESRDFNTLIAAGNESPYGIWSDGTTMWVADRTDDKIYSYNMPPASTDATLSGISVGGKDVAGFDPDDTSYTIGVASTVSEATVTATPTDGYATVAYSGTDADTGTDGHQVALTAGEYTDVTITVTAEDGNTTKIYTVSINRPATITLVSNTAETRIASGSNGFMADSFTTGANPGGYTISEISVHIQQATTGQTTVVTLRENGSDSLPGNIVATLTNPSSFTASALNVFTAPADTTLAASTTYWISVNDGISSNRLTYSNTQSDEQTGQTGWLITDDRKWRSSESNSWAIDRLNLVFEVKGYASTTTDATLSALTVSPKNIIGFEADRTSYEVGVASTVSQATIAATANQSGATVAITPTGRRHRHRRPPGGPLRRPQPRHHHGHR